MRPPANCKALARRLRQDAAPLHGRTYRDMAFAADVLDLLDERAPSTGAWLLGEAFGRAPGRYHVEPEGDR